MYELRVRVRKQGGKDATDGSTVIEERSSPFITDTKLSVSVLAELLALCLIKSASISIIISLIGFQQSLIKKLCFGVLGGFVIEFCKIS